MSFLKFIFQFISQYPILTYVACCLLPVHAILWPLYWWQVDINILKSLKIFFAILPTFSAIFLTFLIAGEDGIFRLFRKTWPQKTQWLWIFFALFVFPFAAIIALVIRYFVDGFFPPLQDFSSITKILAASLPLIFIPGFFEEYGWRGFMQQRLSKKYSTFTASFLVGITWGAWHYMDFLMGNWGMTPKTQLFFMVYIIATAVLVGWVYVNTESIFMAMLAHYGANIVNFFIPLWHNYNNSDLPIYLYLAVLWSIIFIILIINGPSLCHKQIVINEKEHTA